MMNGGLKVLFATGVLMMAGSARAGVISTLYNTGVDGLGTPLPNNTPEIHYALISGPDGNTGVRVGDSTNGYPIGPWVGDDAISAWIGPNGDSVLDGSAGNYDYQTTFDLTGFDPTTASILGQWAMDNSPVDILINGVSISPTVGAGSARGPVFRSVAISWRGSIRWTL